MNIGILGLGKMGSVHAEVFSRNPLCRLYGFYNRTREKAEEFSRKYPGTRVYETWQEMMGDDAIDAVAISTPQYERLQQYRMAVEKGKHLFIEKPMFFSFGDMKETLSLLQDSKVCFYVDSQIENHPAILAVNRELHKVGRIFHIDMELSMYREEVKWKHKLIAGGGVLRELCGHLVDQAGDWLGEAISVTAVNKIVLPGREVEDYTVNLIEYKSGATLLLSGNYFEHKDRLYRGRILGTKGQLDFTFSSYDPADAKATLFIGDRKIPVAIELPEAQEINSVYPGHMDSFQKEADRFIKCAAAGENAADTVQKEAKTTQIICASYESSRKNLKIMLPLHEFDEGSLKSCFKVF